MSRPLPLRPSLEHLKKQAKQLVRGHQSGQVEAFVRLKASFPRLADATVSEILADEFTLCNAQLVIAREHGFATWQQLAAALADPASGALAPLLYDAPSLAWVGERLHTLAATELPVLILAEPGCGAAAAAHAVHRSSERRNGPFLRLSGRTTNPTLLASELFGHVEGAFTGAHVDRAGKVELAHGGTVLLEDVDQLPSDLHATLLQLLQDASFQRVGGEETLQADVRLVATSTPNLLDGGSGFDPELARLLHRSVLRLPPLRERRADIRGLAETFAAQMADTLGRGAPALSDDAVVALEQHEWPGNVSELQCRVQAAVAACEGDTIGPDVLQLS